MIRRSERSGRRFLPAFVLLPAALATGAGAAPLPLPPLPESMPLEVTFEILPAGNDDTLPESIRPLEGGRLVLERVPLRGRTFRRATFSFPLPGGDTRERVLFFSEEEHLSLLGFHRIHRHYGRPSGETIVFNPSERNPVQGRPVEVPEETSTDLSLFVSLGGWIPEASGALERHLWIRGEGVVRARLVPAGSITLESLGTKVRSRLVRLEVGPDHETRAEYWFAESRPHTILQYRGPGGFLVQDEEDVGRVIIRTTSSSDQFERMLAEHDGSGPR